jgi:peptide/nickel transport system substrate-binding protein
MRFSNRWSTIVALAILGVTGCAAPATTVPSTSSGGQANQSQSSTEPSRTGPKRIVAAIAIDMPVFNQDVSTATLGFTGITDLERLVQAGLARRDGQDIPHPELAEQAPSLENGLWKLNPDGTMEITWRIKPNARWHDGTPFTSADLLFTADFWHDRELPISVDARLDELSSITAPDSHTIVARWRGPLLDADQLFSNFASPLPKHILEQPYLADKSTVTVLPYWNTDYVGAGPWKVKDYQQGSLILLTANDDYILGRPKVDELEIRIVLDANTLIANFLSGTIQLGPLGRGLTLDQAREGVGGRSDIKIEMAIRPWVTIWPQLMGANPSVVEDLRFRKGLLHAIDRQTLVDTIQYGYGGVAHTFIGPQDPQYEGVKDVVPKYEYDVRRAEQLFQEAGLSRGPDGKYRDASGQPLRVELRSDASLPIQVKTTTPIAAYWEQVGVSTEINLFPQQRTRELQWFAEFPGFFLARQNNGLPVLRQRTSAFTPTAQNGFRGQNLSRYVNPEFDRLVTAWTVTIDPRQSLELARQINRHIAENLNMMGILYDTEPLLVSSKLVNVDAPNALGGGRQVWRSHEWDVQ